MKRYWYHIRQLDPVVEYGQMTWGDSITIYPKKNGCFRGESEPNISRFCVAPTIAQCIAALGSCCIMNAPIYVYRTAIKYEPNYKLIKSYNVSDSYITDEHWFIKPVRMIFYKIIYQHEYYKAPPSGACEVYGPYWGKYLVKQAKYLHSIFNDKELQCDN